MDNFNADVTGVLLQAKLGLVPKKYVLKVISDLVTMQHAADQVSILASQRLLRVVQGQQRMAGFLDIESQALGLRMSDPKLPVSAAVPLQPALMVELSSRQLSFAGIEKSYENVARMDLGTS